MRNFIVRSEYLEHTGGTKFYETVSIASESNTGANILIKRWGSISVRTGAGQLKIEEFDDRRSLLRAEKTILEKKRKGKSDGAYVDKTSNHGFHTSCWQKSTMLNEKEFAEFLKNHYLDNEGTHDGVFNIINSYEGSTEVNGNDIIVEEPQPEPDRGEQWGSW